MVKNVDRESRKRAVLTAAIKRYIDDAAPVSSDDIASQFGLSSATIRNIFAELEEGRFLKHPHTSAGRIPTDRGYRYYVDFLVSQIALLDEEKEKVTREYRREIRKLGDALERTSELLAALTHYTSIVSLLEEQDIFYKGLSLILEQPEFSDTGRIRLLVKIIEDKERLLAVINRDFKEKVKVYIGDELGCAEMNNCALVISSCWIRNKPVGKIAVLGPTRMKYDHIIPAMEYVSDTLNDILEGI